MGLVRSGALMLITRTVGMAGTWLAALYFTRELANPQPVLGEFYLFETVISLLILLSDGGINSALTKRVSEQDDQEEFFAAGVLLSLLLVAVLSVIIVVGTPFIVDYFGYGGASVLVLLGALWGAQIRNTATSVLLGESRAGISGVVESINSLAQVTGQVLLVSIGFGALGLMTGYMMGAVVAAIAGAFFVTLGLSRPRRHHFERLVSFAKYSFVNGFVQRFYDNIDIIVITAFLGKAASGVYGIGFRFSIVVVLLYSTINSVITPEISKEDARGDQDRIQEMFSDALVLTSLLTIPALVGFAAIARPLIVTFYTAEFQAATAISVGAVATRIPESWRATLGSVLGGIDRPDLVFRGGILLLATNVILDLILVPTIGTIGAVVASFTGMLLQTGYFTYQVKSKLSLRIDDFPIRTVGAEALSAVVMGGTVWLIRHSIDLQAPLELTILIVTGILVYFSILLMVSRGVRERLIPIARDLAGA